MRLFLCPLRLSIFKLKIPGILLSDSHLGEFFRVR